MPNNSISSTRPTTLGKFMRKITKLKISSNVLDDFVYELDNLVTKVTKKSAEYANKEDRKTIMPVDLGKSINDILGKGPLSVEELFKKIEPLTIIELKYLSKKVKDKAEELLKNSALPKSKKSKKSKKNKKK